MTTISTPLLRRPGILFPRGRAAIRRVSHLNRGGRAHAGLPGRPHADAKKSDEARATGPSRGCRPAPLSSGAKPGYGSLPCRRRGAHPSSAAPVIGKKPGYARSPGDHSGRDRQVERRSPARGRRAPLHRERRTPTSHSRGVPRFTSPSAERPVSIRSLNAFSTAANNSAAALSWNERPASTTAAGASRSVF